MGIAALRSACVVVAVALVAAAFAVALHSLPIPAVGGTCGPGKGSESALSAFFDPKSIGAGQEPSASSGGRPAWRAFVSDCQSATDRRMVVSGSVLVGAILVGIGLPWVLGRVTKEQMTALAAQHSPDDPAAPPLPPAGWYPDPANPSALRWWDGSAWALSHNAL
jgi:Protein of unknown function (DUF2510)